MPSELNSDYSPSVTTAVSTDLSPIVVTAQKMPVPFDLADWFKPPKVFLSIGLGAAVVYFMMNRKGKRK